MLNEYAAAFMAVVLVIQTVVSYLERRRLIKQNEQLMDRLMSIDFQSYAAGKRIQHTGESRWKKKEAEKQEEEAPAQEHIGLSVV